MIEVIIIGAGGHAAEIDEYISFSQKNSGKDLEKIKIIGFLDDSAGSYNSYMFSAPYLGTVKDHVIVRGQNYLMGIAGLEFRRPIIEKFKIRGGEFLSFIHCSAYVSKSATIGEGSILGPHVNIGPNVRIGNYNLINSRCSLGHDTIIGNYNFISPNVCFSGFSKVGDENLFGINSATLPGISIGNSNKIAAGMILDQNVSDDTTVFYRHKEKVIAIPRSNNEMEKM